MTSLRMFACCAASTAFLCAPFAVAQPSSGSPIFAPYKDITVNLNWNTYVISTNLNHAPFPTPLLDVLRPYGNKQVIVWGFATGNCGNERWASLTPDQVKANAQAFHAAHQPYILATGGAAGAFSCDSDQGFEKFIETYYTPSLKGVDFDIETGQSPQAIAELVARVVHAQTIKKYQNLRYSFTIATLAGIQNDELNDTGQAVIQAIQDAKLKNYVINLMTMDYGSTSEQNCVVVGNQCDMAQSAMRAADRLHSHYGVPYDQIAVTPMIGDNDTVDEFFTLGNVDALMKYAREKGLNAVHFWAFDRDTPCSGANAQATCNTVGTKPLDFFERFLKEASSTAR